MNVRDLSEDDLKALIREAVEEALTDLLGDPDQGLKVREAVKARLHASLAQVERGAQGVRLEEVMGRIEQAQ